MRAPRRIYWWIVRRLPPRYARALRSAVVYVGTGGRRRALAPGLTSTIKFTPPRLKLLCIALEVSEAELAALVDRVLGIAVDPTRVAFVSDNDAVHLFRKRGCRFEYVPPRVDWEAHFPERDYESFLGHRIDSLFGVYGVERTMTFGSIPDGLLLGLAGEPARLAVAGAR